MVMSCPECPQNSDELGMLIYALTDPRFNKTPEEYQRWLDGEVERLRSQGQVQKSELYRKLNDFPEEFREAQSYMQRWGKTRKEAARNYFSHFKKPCNWCMDIYTDILAMEAVDLMTEEGIDPSKASKETANNFTHMAHLQYLGHPELVKLTEIKLEDIFLHNN